MGTCCEDWKEIRELITPVKQLFLEQVVLDAKKESRPIPLCISFVRSSCHDIEIAYYDSQLDDVETIKQVVADMQGACGLLEGSVPYASALVAVVPRSSALALLRAPNIPKSPHIGVVHIEHLYAGTSTQVVAIEGEKVGEWLAVEYRSACPVPSIMPREAYSKLSEKTFGTKVAEA